MASWGGLLKNYSLTDELVGLMCDISARFAKLEYINHLPRAISESGTGDKIFDFLKKFDDSNISSEVIESAVVAVTGKDRGEVGYRECADLIVNDDTGELLYAPPLPCDIDTIMSEFIDSLNDEVLKKQRHYLIISGECICQMMTVMPYKDISFDVGALLSSLVMKQHGVSQNILMAIFSFLKENKHFFEKVFFSLGPKNFYERKFGPDITSFLMLFFQKISECMNNMYESVDAGHANVFPISNSSQPLADSNVRDIPPNLTDDQAKVLNFFKKKRTLFSHDLEKMLGIANRQARALCYRWVTSGFLTIQDSSKRARRYGIGKKFARFL